MLKDHGKISMLVILRSSSRAECENVQKEIENNILTPN
jgi:hypothetical protein